MSAPNSTQEASSDEAPNIFATAILSFADSIDSLLASLPGVSATMRSDVTNHQLELESFLAKFESDEESPNGEKMFKISAVSIPQFIKLDRKISMSMRAHRLLHRGFLISLISQYDAFLGCLLKEYFQLTQGRLDSSEKQFSFKDLMDLGSIEEARNHLIEKEVDTIIRKSHEDHIDWINSNLKIKLREFIPEVPAFVEIAQRRHFVRSLQWNC